MSLPMLSALAGTLGTGLFLGSGKVGRSHHMFGRVRTRRPTHKVISL